MNTDKLIESLAGEVRPIPAGRAAGRLGLCAGAALLTAGLVVWLTLGFRPDLAAMAGDPMFLMRQIYVLSIAGLASLLLLRLGQPGAPVRLPLVGLAVVAFGVVLAVLVEQAGLSGPARGAAWLGHSWTTCTIRVVGVSLVAIPFVVFAARRLAPQSPTRAGFVAGLVAGGVAASAYGFYCEEVTASFMASWYTLGILISGAIGALTGRVLLRW
ncbi:MAG: hypothetical protein ACI9YM_000759 [Brevundimonas sp.]|jgi:hypothetical protein|uniref:NrsF family protein n=1 Tax=Brevundimonas sp. TaxID=1871086 RepID=UPI0039E60B13